MNILTITGCIVREPQSKDTESGYKLTTFTIVHSIGHKDKKEEIFWDVALWGTRYEKIIPYLQKGKIVTVVGTLSRKPHFFKDGAEIRMANLSLTGEMVYLHPSRDDKKNEAPF